MIDLETLGAATDSAPVISIGAVRFDIHAEEVDLDHSFHKNIQLDDSLKYGTVESGTLKWWLSNEDKRKIFRNIIFDKEAVPLRDALDELRVWVSENKNVTPWAKGIDFDFGILDRCYRSTGTHNPFNQYWKRRDVRTLVDLAKHAGANGVDPVRNESEAHDALADVIHQAREVIAYTKYLRNLGESAVDTPPDDMLE